MYTRVVTATMESQSISTADAPLIELQMPANSVADIIRVEIGAAEGTDPVAEVQELAFYTATGPGTGGTGLTEHRIRGSGTISGVALRNLTAVGTGPLEVIHTAWNVQVPYLYLPVPEERIRLRAGGQDNFGFLFPTVPDAAITLSATVIWGEIAT